MVNLRAYATLENTIKTLEKAKILIILLIDEKMKV